MKYKCQMSVRNGIYSKEIEVDAFVYKDGFVELWFKGILVVVLGSHTLNFIELLEEKL